MTAKPQKGVVWTRAAVLSVKLADLTEAERDLIPCVVDYMSPTRAIAFHPISHHENLRMAVWRLARKGFTCIEKNS